MGVEIDHKNITFEDDVDDKKREEIKQKEQEQEEKEREEQKLDFRDIDAVKYSSHSSFTSLQNGNEFS